MISERLVDVTKDCRGKYLRAFGQFRSYNKHEENHNHLILSVFVRDLEFLDSMEDVKPNQIQLDGFICKQPVYRMASPIISLVSAGEGMPDLRAAWKSEPGLNWWEGSRAVNTRKGSVNLRLLRERPMKFL